MAAKNEVDESNDSKQAAGVVINGAGCTVVTGDHNTINCGQCPDSASVERSAQIVTGDTIKDTKRHHAYGELHQAVGALGRFMAILNQYK